MTEQVTINDVGPRDGLQNQTEILSVEQRLQLIHGLLDAGVTSVEVGSFVSPKAVPAMMGTDRLFGFLEATQASLFGLIPNQRGYELAKAAGAKYLSVLTCATETMNQNNVRMSVNESMAQNQAIMAAAQNDGISISGCVAVAWECPFEGKTDARKVQELVQQFFAMGAREVVVADTIGAANPQSVYTLMSDLVSQHGVRKLSCHFHDTRAMGVANVFAALQAGIRKFDASVGGLGGCPFAPGATGNVATEDVVMMLHQMGYYTGIDLQKLMAVGQRAGRMLGIDTGGRANRWRQLQLENGKSLS
ncbi:MAG: hydroxymethylglutaryl-CoA lyase [Haliea sp.]